MVYQSTSPSFYFNSKFSLSQSAMTKTSEGKDDDDDDDNDDDDKLTMGSDIDPERLKAFNVSSYETLRSCDLSC